MKNLGVYNKDIKREIFSLDNNLEKSKKTLATSSPLKKSSLEVDNISISTTAKILQNFKDENSIQMVSDLLERLTKKDGNEKDYLSERLKCIKIAISIINGDQVPEKDERFLAKTEPEMYFRAILLRRKNENSKKKESELNNSDDDNEVRVNISLENNSHDGVVESVDDNS